MMNRQVKVYAIEDYHVKCSMSYPAAILSMAISVCVVYICMYIHTHTHMYVCTSVVPIATFRGIPISDYFNFQTADISIQYRLLQTYNKTHK